MKGGDFHLALGHNACGIGGAGSVLGSNNCLGTDAGRNIAAGAARTLLVGTGAGQNINGTDDLVLVAGGGNTTGLSTGIQNTLIHGGATLATGNGNLVGGYKSDVTGSAVGDAVILGGTAAGGGNGARGGGSSVVIGARAGNGSLTGATNTLIGKSVGATNCTTGTGNLLIDSGAATLDCKAAGVSNQLTIANVIGGDTSTATNPMLCHVGGRCVIGVLRAANFNVTTDQSITIRPLTSTDTGYVPSATKYFITDIYVANCSASPGTAAGGFYTGASKTGTIVGATTTTFTNCTSSTTAHRLTGLTNEDTTLFSAATLNLSLTTAKGSAGTGDIYIIGELVN